MLYCGLWTLSCGLSFFWTCLGSFFGRVVYISLNADISFYNLNAVEWQLMVGSSLKIRLLQLVYEMPGMFFFPSILTIYGTILINEGNLHWLSALFLYIFNVFVRILLPIWNYNYNSRSHLSSGLISCIENCKLIKYFA